MLCLFSKSNPQKGRWSTLPENTAINALPMIGTGDRTATLQADRSIPTLGQRWCWILYNSQVVDRVITIVHHSRYYVSICHYMSLYVYDIKKYTDNVMVFTLRCYLVVQYIISLQGQTKTLRVHGTTGTTGARPNLKKKQNTINKGNLEDVTKFIQILCTKVCKNPIPKPLGIIFWSLMPFEI